MPRAGVAIPATEEAWNTGYKLTARRESDRVCDIRCAIGAEWSGWHAQDMPGYRDPRFHRLALLVGPSPRRTYGDLLFSVAVRR